MLISANKSDASSDLAHGFKSALAFGGALHTNRHDGMHLLDASTANPAGAADFQSRNVVIRHSQPTPNSEVPLALGGERVWCHQA